MKRVGRQRLADRAARAGFQRRVYTGLLRHRFATNLLRKRGIPLLSSGSLGHESLAMITYTSSDLTVDPGAGDTT